MHTKQLTNGQSFIELIIALVLVSITLTAVVALTTKGIANNSFNRNKTLSNNYVTEALEWLRGERDANWSAFYTHAATATWCTPSLAWAFQSACNINNPAHFIPQTIYLREISLQRVNVNTISAVVTVRWTDSNGVHSSQSSGEFSNWKGNQ